MKAVIWPMQNLLTLVGFLIVTIGRYEELILSNKSSQGYIFSLLAQISQILNELDMARSCIYGRSENEY